MKERLEKPIIPVPRIPDRAFSRERRWGEESALPETIKLLDAMTSENDREYDRSLTKELAKFRKEGGGTVLKVRDALVREKLVLDDMFALIKTTVAEGGKVMAVLKEFTHKEHFWIPGITFEYLWGQFKKPLFGGGLFRGKNVLSPTEINKDYEPSQKEEKNLLEALEVLIGRYQMAIDGLDGVYVALGIEQQVRSLPEDGNHAASLDKNSAA